MTNQAVETKAVETKAVELSDKDLDAVSGGMQTANPVLIAVFRA
jgi:bacteriocin-like protein